MTSGNSQKYEDEGFGLGPVQQLRFRNRRLLKSGDFETGNAKSAVALESHCVTPFFCLANFEHFSSIVLSIPCYNGLQPLKTSQKAKAYNASLCSKKKQKRWATELVATVVITHYMLLFPLRVL